MAHPRARPAGSLIAALEHTAAAVGLEVRRERLEIGDARLPGGLCRLADGRPLCLISDALGEDEEARILGGALLEFDLEDVYMPPAARTFLDTLRPSDGKGPRP